MAVPLPTLRGYAALSGVALAAAGYHALRLGQRDPAAPGDYLADQLSAAAPYMLREPLCLWALVHCVCIVCVHWSRSLANHTLGGVRPTEAACCRDVLTNYAFHKLMVVVGVVGVQYADQLLLAAAWCTLLGALTALHTLANARLQQLGEGSGAAAARGAELLGGVAAGGGALLLIATWPLTIQPAYATTLMAAECVVVCLWGLHACTRRSLARHDNNYIGFDTLAQGAEALHVLHMWCRSGLLLSLPALVLLLRLRRVLHELRASLRAASLQRATNRTVTNHYPLASAEEVKKNQDKCAICWEPMEQARRLPCHHLFHNTCLCRWVAQDPSCPTCRRGLSALQTPPPEPHTANHLFHFDGSRYVSWLPSVSVEVTRSHAALPNAALRAMAAQVQQLFPHYPPGTLLADLSVTHSSHLTIDNILSGRLSAPITPTADTDTAMGGPPSPAASAPAPAPATRDQAASAHLIEVRTNNARDDDDTLSLSVPIEFSSEAREREALLARRKRALLAAARQRYLQRHPTKS